jgi:cytochrome c551/c552
VIRAGWYAGAALVTATVSLLSGFARPDAAGDVAASGVELFRTKGCATCHDGPDGTSLTDAGP